MATFTAKYKGTCTQCDSVIEQGDEVTYSGAGLVHVTCPDNVAEVEYGYCPSCFIGLPATGVCTNCD